MTAQVTGEELVAVGGLVIAALVLLTTVLALFAKGAWTLGNAIKQRLDKQDARIDGHDQRFAEQDLRSAALERIAKQMEEMLHNHDTVYREYVKVRSARDMVTEMLKMEKEIKDAESIPRIPRKSEA